MPRFKETIKDVGSQIRQRTPLYKSPHEPTTRLDRTLSRIMNLPIATRTTSRGKAEAIPYVGAKIEFWDLPGEGKLIGRRIQKEEQMKARGVGSTPVRKKR